MAAIESLFKRLLSCGVVTWPPTAETSEKFEMLKDLAGDLRRTRSHLWTVIKVKKGG